MKSSQVSAFADDRNIFKTMISQEDSSLLQADLINKSELKRKIFTQLAVSLSESRRDVKRTRKKM